MMDQLKNLKTLASLMGNRDELRARFEQLQAELGKKTAEGDAGAGAVRVTVNGRLEVQRVELDSAMIATLTPGHGDEDKAMIEELIASATNDAMRKAQQLAKEEMARLAGGLNLPGMEGLLG